MTAILPIFAVVVALFLAWRAPTWLLVANVRGLMLHSHTKQNAKTLRTIMLLDGHRMPKKLKDSLSVWLSEHEE